MATAAEEIAALRGTKPATFRDLLTHRSFSRLWRAMLVSSLGDWVGFVAVASLVVTLGGRHLGGLAVAGVMLARLLPSVLFGAFAGVVVDRFDRKRIMVMADIGRGAMYASMPFLPTLWMIFVLSFFIESLSLVWTPAKDSSIPNLVPRRQLSNANSVGLITTYGTLPLGASVYTALAAIAPHLDGHLRYLDHHPESLALWLDALTFTFSARMVSGLDLRLGAAARRRLQTTKLSASGAVADVREGVRFLREHSLVRAMTLGIVMAFTGAGAVISIGPAFARYSVGAGATGFGYLMMALGVGMGAGMGLIGVVSKRVDKEKVFGPALVGSGILLFVLALMPSIGLAALFTVPMGVGAGLAWVIGYTMLQENVADDFRGRTFGTLTVMVRMALFASLFLFPVVATAVGTHLVSVGSTTLDFSGYRVALWLGAGMTVLAGVRSGESLRRHRIARPRALALVPKLRHGERPGAFIVFEGVEGSGKGTQLARAGEYLEAKGRDVVRCREPGGTGFGERLRETILDPRTGTVDPRAEALLFAAARAQLVATVIRPALEEGKVVLCDRFVDSSVAYQGVARGLGEPDVLSLNAWATQGLFPDLVLLLHLDPGVGLSRAGEGDGTGLDRIESEDEAFHAKVADAYLKIAEEHPERLVAIDASEPVDEVQGRVRQEIDRVLARMDGRTGGR